MSRMILISLATLWLTSAVVCGQKVGQVFPDFDATDPISKKKFKLSDYRGHVVLVDFWATWCPPCRAEIPNLVKVYREYKDLGFVVISISLDSDASKFRSYVSSNGMDWLHVMDGGGWDTRLAKKYGIRSIPAMFLLDHEGVCISSNARGQELERAVAQAIKQLPEPPPAAGAATEESAKPASIDRYKKELEQLMLQLRESETVIEDPLEKIVALRETFQAATKASSENPQSDALPGEIKTQVNRVRAELFALGLLKDDAAALSHNDSAGSAAALEKIEQTLAKAREEIAASVKNVAALREELQRGPMPLNVAREKFEGVSKPASALAQRWGGAWQAQLAELSSLLKQWDEQDRAVPDRLAAAERLVTDVRVRLNSRPRSAGALRVLNDDFTRVRTELSELCRLLCADAADQCKLPEDPFAGGSTDDPLVARELEKQLLTAAQAIKQMKPKAAKFADARKQNRVQFASQVEQLQHELKRAGDADSREQLRQRFVDLCSQVLATAA